MVMLLLSFLCHGILQLKNTRLGLFPHNYRRPEKKKIVTNVVYYTVAFLVHNSFVKWNNNLLLGSINFLLSRLLLLLLKNYIKMQRVMTT